MELTRLPASNPTDEAFAALDRDGAIVLTEAAPEETLALAERELAPWLTRPVTRSPMGNNVFAGHRTLRTSALIAKSVACGQLAMHRGVLALVDRVLGPQCSRFQIAVTQAVKIGAGEQAQAAHRDTSIYPLRRPGPEVFVNTMWALSDFTAANGATRLYLGSHRWSEGRLPTTDDRPTAAAMPRGSVLIYYGSCFHNGGANTTAHEDRTGMIIGYVLGWLRQEENQYLAVPPETARTLPIELQRLLGYAEHHPIIGWYEGQDHALMRGGDAREDYATAIEGGRSQTIRRLLDEGKASSGA